MQRTPHDLLHDLYGFTEFRGEQLAIIETVVGGGDALVLMPTGGGKSLCYQLPALLRAGVGVVVSPLIALMQDQVDALHRLGIAAAFLNSSQSREESWAVRQQLQRGQLDLLYVAPERLLMEDTLALLDECPVALFAIDEAHCVSQWGHDFRSDYLGLSVLEARYPNVPRIALTATADARTREEIAARLGLLNAPRFISSFDRPNIRYRVGVKKDVRRQLAQFLASHEDHAGIIYCQSRARTEQIATQLAGDGWTALPYHAGLPQETRREHQQRFLREEGVIIVATIAFGMGIDKPDVRFVVHLDLPKSMEAYYQETGRAGRDGAAAEAWMIYGLQDVVRLRQMVDESEAEESYKRVERSKLDALLGWCELTTCRRQALLAYFDETLAEPCGNCDVCLTPPETFDGTEAAQKLLSCVYRTGQRFGAGHVIDVLRGRSTDKTQQFGHEQVSTWGIGSDVPESQWRTVVRALIARGALFAHPDRYNGLRFGESARDYLKGAEPLILRLETATAGGSRKRQARQVAETDLAPGDEALFNALRACRRRIAEAEGVPPYVVFHDATLRGLVHLRPTSMGQMLEVHGIGQTRLQRYGEAFLEVLREHEYEVDEP